MKKYIKLGLSLGFTGLFLVFSYKNMSQLDLVAIRDFDFHYPNIIFSILAFMLGLFFRSMAWAKGLNQNLRLKKAFQGVTIGMAANMVLPFRMGEVAKSALLNTDTSLSSNKDNQKLRDYYVVGLNILFERLFDVLILGGLLIITLWFVDFSGDMEDKASLLMRLGLIGFALLGLGILAFHFLKDFLSSKSTKVRSFYDWTLKVQVLTSLQAAYQTLVYLILSWFSVYLSTFFGLLAIGRPVSEALKASLVVLVLVNLAILVPTAPGGIGAFQFACVYGLSFFRMDDLSVFVASILLHLVQYIAALPLGLVCFIIWRLSNEKNL